MTEEVIVIAKWDYTAQQDQELDALDEGLRRRYYPQDVDGSYPGSNRDHHVAFYGEIVAAYIIE